MQPIQGGCPQKRSYRFCSTNALYSASLSFRMFIIIQIKSQDGVAHESVDYKKAFNVAVQSSKND